MSLPQQNQNNSSFAHSRGSKEQKGRMLQTASNREKHSDTSAIKNQKRESQKEGKISLKSVSNSHRKSAMEKNSSQVQYLSQTKPIKVMKEQILAQHQKSSNSKHETKKQSLDFNDSGQGRPKERILKQNQLNASSNNEKVKIGSRFRKLVLQYEGLQKLMEAAGDDSSLIRKQQKEYGQIANDIKINTLQSKVIIEVPGNPKDHVLHKLTEQQSMQMPTPANSKKQYLQIVDQKGLKAEFHHFGLKQSGGNNEKSFFDLNSIEEEALNKSVERAIQQENKEQIQGSKLCQTRQVSLNIAQSSRSNKKQDDSNRWRITENNVNVLSQEKERRMNMKKQKNKIVSNIFNEKVIDKVTKKFSEIHNQNLQDELQNLRNAVKELRLEKIKERAQKQYLELKQQKIFKTQSKRQNKQLFNSSRETAQTNMKPRKQSLSGEKDKGPIIFGRIKKNKPEGKLSHSLDQSSKDKFTESPLINFEKLVTNHHQKVIQSYRQRKPTDSYYQSQDSSQFKTLDVAKSGQQNVEEPSFQRRGFTTSLDMSRETFGFGSSGKKGNEICSRVLNKFESDNKKFHKFIIREQSRSRYRLKKMVEQEINQEAISDPPQLLPKERQNEFEGTIIKNIVRPLYGSDQYMRSQSAESFMDKNTLRLIQASQKKTVKKRNIQAPQVQIPNIPDPLTVSTSTEQIMDSIIKLLPFSDETYNEEELTGCSLKKFKNCLMFELPNNSHFRIVWHFSGKLYIGEWDNQKNQKSGEGLEYFPGKYFYKGEFLIGKKYGKGVLLHDNGSFYEGQFINGDRYGKGKFYDSCEKSYYQGQWACNKMEGMGYFQFQGSFYEGHFKENLKDGFGIEIFGNGDKYFGQYSKDKFQGEGKYLWADGSSYVGHFKQGYRHDYGKWMSATDPPEIYTGFYAKDKKQGLGKYVWNNGCVYEGNFDNDIKHGVGSIQYPNGQYLQGVWTQGILTEVLSKLSEAHVEEPLAEPKTRKCQTRTKIKIIDIDGSQT